MKVQTRWIIVFVLFLVLSSLACQALLGDDEAEVQVEEAVTVQAVEAEVPEEEVAEIEIEPTEVSQQPTEEPDTPTPTEEPEATAEEQEAIFAMPEEPDSYRLVFAMSIFSSTDEDSEPVVVISGEGAITNDPPASSLSFNISGIEGTETFSDMTMVEIDGQTYFTLPTGDCLSGLFSQEDFPFDEIVRGSDYAEGLSDAGLVERNVEINGVMTDHYSFDQTNLDGSAFFDDSMEEFEGNIYLSEEGNIVRVDFSGIGGVDIPGTESIDGGRMTYQLDFFDINEPIEITIPEGCGEAGATDLPLVSDAFELNAFAGITSYKSNLSVNDIAEFYRTEMPGAGWSLDSEISAGTSVILSYSLDDQIVLITIDEDPASDARTVSIFEQ